MLNFISISGLVQESACQVSAAGQTEPVIGKNAAVKDDKIAEIAAPYSYHRLTIALSYLR